MALPNRPFSYLICPHYEINIAYRSIIPRKTTKQLKEIKRETEKAEKEYKDVKIIDGYMHGEGTNQKYWYKIQKVGWLVREDIFLKRHNEM